jgi:hypothetical protein
MYTSVNIETKTITKTLRVTIKKRFDDLTKAKLSYFQLESKQDQSVLRAVTVSM